MMPGSSGFGGFSGSSQFQANNPYLQGMVFPNENGGNMPTNQQQTGWVTRNGISMETPGGVGLYPTPGTQVRDKSDPLNAMNPR